MEPISKTVDCLSICKPTPPSSVFYNAFTICNIINVGT